MQLEICHGFYNQICGVERSLNVQAVYKHIVKLRIHGREMMQSRKMQRYVCVFMRFVVLAGII